MIEMKEWKIKHTTKDNLYSLVVKVNDYIIPRVT